MNSNLPSVIADFGNVQRSQEVMNACGDAAAGNTSYLKICILMMYRRVFIYM